MLDREVNERRYVAEREHCSKLLTRLENDMLLLVHVLRGSRFCLVDLVLEVKIEGLRDVGRKEAL